MPKHSIHTFAGCNIVASLKDVEDESGATQKVCVIEIQDPAGELYRIGFDLEVRDTLVRGMTGGIVPATMADLSSISDGS